MTPAPHFRSPNKAVRIFALVFIAPALVVSACGLPASAQSPAETQPATPPKTNSVVPPPPSKHQKQAAEDAYLDGARALDHRDLARAEAQFTKALKLNPSNHDYAMALTVTREHRVTELVQQASKARILGQNEKAESLFAEARNLDPQNAIVLQHADPGPLPITFTPKLESSSLDAAPLAGEIILAPNGSSQNFHLHSDVQNVLRQVASTFGIRTVFDDSVPHQALRFDLDNTTYQQCMPILLDMAHLFAVPLDQHSILIAQDSLENRQRLERQLQETIYIPAMTNEQMSELNNVVRNIFDLKQVSVQNSAGTMVVRAPANLFPAINRTLADLIDGGSQVMLDLNLYSIDKTHSREIGTKLPQQFGVYNVASAANDIVNANQGLVNQAIAQGLVTPDASNITIALALIASGLVQSTLLSSTVGFFGGGITTFGLTASSNPTFTLALNTSDTRAVDHVQLRVGDRQTATFRAGTRYPITTSTYSTGAPNASALSGVSINGVSAASLLSQFLGNTNGTTIPEIQYEDLGITLKATPIVQKSNNVSIHLDLKIEALTGGSIDNIPVLTNRQFASDITVVDGETALLISSLSKTESAAVTGLPGLGELPGFQYAVADKLVETNSSELVLLITPHIVRRRSNLINGPRIVIKLPQTSD
jgi:general secretion pathway protein D